MSLAYAGKGFAYTTRICEKSVLSQTIGRQHAFFLVDPNAPIAGENTLQRFRLSRTTIPVSVNIFQKTINPFERFFILILPKDIRFPRFVMPNLFHYSSISSCSYTFRPAFISAMRRSNIAMCSES